MCVATLELPYETRMMYVNPMTVFCSDLSLEEEIANEKEAQLYEDEREEDNTYDADWDK